MSQYLAAADKISQLVETRLSKIAQCAETDTDEACAAHFIEVFGRRAYRHALSQQEKADLKLIYTDSRSAGTDLPGAIREVVSAILQAPQFLYLAEFGAGGVRPSGATPLTGYEIAARMSYLLWQSSPDETLLQSAEAGGLSDRDERAKQAERMLQDARASRGVAEFAALWLKYSELRYTQKDSTVYPDFDSTLKASMRSAADAFASDVVLNGDGSLATLLTASYAFVDAPLAKLYGMAPPAAGLSRTDMTRDHKVGILTEPALLSQAATPGEGSPVRRGKLILLQLLCQTISPPPPGVNMKLPDPMAGQSQRARFAAHAAPACHSCHGRMDPIGYALGNYDGVGHYIDSDSAGPIDASGELSQTDVDGPFNGPTELAQRLAGSNDVRQCLARQWFRFALRRVESLSDTDTLADINTGFAQHGYNLRSLLVELINSQAFTVRYPAKETTP